MAQTRGIPRPFNPFLAEENAAAYPPRIGELPPPVPQPNPMRGAPPMPPPPTMADFGQRFDPAPAGMGAGAIPMLGGQPPQGGGFMATAKGGLNDFLGSDASLAMAAGLLGGGSTSQAIGRGFAGAGQAMAGDRQRQAEAARENRTVEYFQKMGRPDLAEMVLAGGGVEAFKALQDGSQGPDFGDQAKLRGEFLKANQDFTMVRDAYARLKASASEETGASDIAMVYSYMKMLDPGSVVREGEFATAENAGGIPDQLRTMYNRAISGERLSPKVRREFLSQAGKQYESATARLRSTERTYDELAGSYRMDPNQITPDLAAGVELSPVDPMPDQMVPGETVVDGYVYKGGDPALMESWQRIR